MIAQIGKNMFILVGNATRNAEFKTVGEKQTPLAKFSLAIGKDETGGTRYADCNAWSRLSNYARGICKGDLVQVIGPLDERQGNEGKTFKAINAEWVIVLEKALSSPPMSQPPKQDQPVPLQEEQGACYTFDEEDSDSFPF